MGGASGDPMVTRPKWPSLLKPRLISILYKPRRRPCPRKTDLERSVPLDIFLPAEATDRAADGSGAPCDGGGFECDPSRCVGVVRGQRVEIDRKKLPPIPVGPLLVPPQAVLGATRTLERLQQYLCQPVGAPRQWEVHFCRLGVEEVTRSSRIRQHRVLASQPWSLQDPIISGRAGVFDPNREIGHQSTTILS